MGEIALEAFYIFSACPAPGVNHLVVVAHYAHISQSLMPIISAEAQQAYQLILRQVAVLELVNMDILPACLVRAQHFWFAPPQLFPQHHKIVEIDPLIGASEPRVLLVD